jgi:ABC-type multidrug transport system fused ATPase/permease subunit
MSKKGSNNQISIESDLGMMSLLIRYYRMTRHYMQFRMYVLFALNLLSILIESIGLLLFIPFFRTLDLGSKQSDSISGPMHNIFNSLGIEVTVSIALMLLACAFTLKGIAVFFIAAYRRHISSLLLFNIREDLIQKNSKLDYLYTTNKNAGFFGNLIITETDRAINVMNAYCRCLTSLATTIIFIATALLVYPQLSFVIIFAGLLNVFILRFISKLGRRYSWQISQLNARLNGLLIELLHSSKYLKATSQFTALQNIIQATNKKTASLQLKRNLANSAYEAVREPVLVLFICAIIYFYVVISGQSIALILVPILFFYRCMLEAGFAQSNWQSVCDDSGALETLFLASHDLVKHVESNIGESPALFHSNITLENVNFSYNQSRVLKNININIPKFSSVAFVGISGEGKTTLADTLCGILKPQSGAVYLDGINLNMLDPESYRSKIGYVVQDTVIFSDTLANNISMELGSMPNNEKLAKVQQVAIISHVDEFVSKMPEGYQTLVGERGIRLSGGQRQRIAIARELYRQPEILILDESTSALDSQSEQFIKQSIQSLRGKTTLIIISHRLSTISHVDQIYVMRHGEIIEQGTFEELLNSKNTYFREICELQQIGSSNYESQSAKSHE